MNHVSIFEQKWLDLVFEGRNKAYGAYRLRQENPRTTMIALFYGLLFLSGVSATLALSSIVERPVVAPALIDDEIHVTKVVFAQPKQPEKAATPLAPQKPKPSDNLPPVVAPTPDPTPDPKPETKPGTGTQTSGEGTESPGTAGTGTETSPSTELPPGDAVPVPTYAVDKLPVYKLGMPSFYSEVGRKFNRPEIDDMKTARVMVSFVIEKDGSLTDIKILRDPGYGMGKEAIRVLKSLIEKWEPGLVKGKPVRTLYTLPITVNME